MTLPQIISRAWLIQQKTEDWARRRFSREPQPKHINTVWENRTLGFVSVMGLVMTGAGVVYKQPHWVMLGLFLSVVAIFDNGENREG